ncbi:aldehyde dehydrogenase (NAD+) [Flavobacteriaceae bacterium MAR_2010_188]|nr:aldehyde dehydrogenase (NAD+) [Flavobacteriaceae bacterium MAR_2010_188]
MEETTTNRYKDLFDRLNANKFLVASTSFQYRKNKLKKLQKCVENTYKQRLRDALYQDFQKPQLEVDLTEILPLIEEIKHAIHYLRFWMKNEKIKTPISLFGSSSYIKYEPKGVCLIISPWNYPVNLTLCPLVSAIAAGNVVIVKPSELTPNTSKVMKDIIHEVFTKDEVCLVEGDAETAKSLLKLPFNHIFFTGSPAIGKKVMEAAAQNLCSVTLELGGKSPTIIDKSVDIKVVANKIAFGKFMNAGQTCIAPDYIMIDESIQTKFIEALQNALKSFYENDIENSASYSRIVNQKHANHLNDLLMDCKEKGASLYQLASPKPAKAFISPTIVTGVDESMELMQEEIFGPILPIITFKELEECTSYISRNEKPLAVYIFSKNKKAVDFLIENTRAGTTCVNHNMLQYLNVNLPFGGSNNSGIGKSHGISGFKEFSNSRAVLKQHTISAADLLRPPYSSFKQKLVDLTIKWL